MTALAADSLVLCRLEEIEDGGAKGFTLGEGLDAEELFVVREGRRLRAYVNSCPHTGVPLELVPDRFLNADGSYIICSTHGALFRIGDGYCVAGPCAGDCLTPLEVALDAEDRVVLGRPAAGSAASLGEGGPAQ